jgi:hypothetical protein
MAQTAIETDESTDVEALHCQHCGEEIPGTPFAPFRDIVRNTAGELVLKPDADTFCDVTCRSEYEATEASNA